MDIIITPEFCEKNNCKMIHAQKFKAQFYATVYPDLMKRYQKIIIDSCGIKAVRHPSFYDCLAEKVHQLQSNKGCLDIAAYHIEYLLNTCLFAQWFGDAFMRKLPVYDNDNMAICLNGVGGSGKSFFAKGLEQVFSKYIWNWDEEYQNPAILDSCFTEVQELNWLTNIFSGKKINGMKELFDFA